MRASEIESLPDRWRGTRHALIFEGVAVLVAPWRAPSRPPERGARIELRILDAQPHRGSPVASQRLVLDEPRLRVDLFDQADRPPGNLLAAHNHPAFEGVEPCEREWVEQLQTDPHGWLADTFGDLPRLLEQSGGIPADAKWVEADTEAVRAAIPFILAAVDDALETVRREAL